MGDEGCDGSSGVGAGGEEYRWCDPFLGGASRSHSCPRREALSGRDVERGISDGCDGGFTSNEKRSSAVDNLYRSPLTVGFRLGERDGAEAPLVGGGTAEEPASDPSPFG